MTPTTHHAFQVSGGKSLLGIGVALSGQNRTGEGPEESAFTALLLRRKYLLGAVHINAQLRTQEAQSVFTVG